VLGETGVGILVAVAVDEDKGLSEGEGGPLVEKLLVNDFT
jgi:hypothetical protein